LRRERVRWRRVSDPRIGYGVGLSFFEGGISMLCISASKLLQEEVNT